MYYMTEAVCGGDAQREWKGQSVQRDEGHLAIPTRHYQP